MAKSKSSADPRVDALVDIVRELLAHASFPMLAGQEADDLRARAAELTAPVEADEAPAA